MTSVEQVVAGSVQPAAFNPSLVNLGLGEIPSGITESAAWYSQVFSRSSPSLGASCSLVVGNFRRSCAIVPSVLNS